jgi:hypothetical protein
MTLRTRDDLAESVRASLARIDSILKQHDATVRDLPAQSRRALIYLKQIDFARIPVYSGAGGSTETRETAESHSATTSFRGLRSFLERLLDNLALSTQDRKGDRKATYNVIARTTERLDRSMSEDGTTSAELTTESRQILGWLRYFADQERFADYLEALDRALGVFEKLPFEQRGWKPPFLLHFRPSRQIYRCRQSSHGLRVVLQTPMIAFDHSIFEKLGRQILGSKSHQPAISEAMLSECYQVILCDMENAGGVVEITAGAHYDLIEVFDRVNREYFHGRMNKPRLRWIPTLTRNVFGHYDFVRDLLSISRTLDHPSVQAFVVDHVMHHELLHKKHGFRWKGRSLHSHTPEFRAEERTFRRFDEAGAFINKLSRQAI